MTDPLTGLALFNAIAAAGKTVFNIAQGASNSDAKRQLMEVYDTLMNLKRQANDLEDENRELKNKLRFKGQDFEFKNPFWYEKVHPDQPLCPKCFANGKIGQMGEAGFGCNSGYRCCLVCGEFVQIRAEVTGSVRRRPYRGFSPR